LEGAIPVTQKDGDGWSVGDDYVELAIAVHIGHGQRIHAACRSSEADCRFEGPVAIAQQHANLCVIEVSYDKVKFSIVVHVRLDHLNGIGPHSVADARQEAAYRVCRVERDGAEGRAGGRVFEDNVARRRAVAKAIHRRVERITALDAAGRENSRAGILAGHGDGFGRGSAGPSGCPCRRMLAVRLCVPTTKSADSYVAMPVALTTSTVAMALAPS
jgi:hypothetical protein